MTIFNRSSETKAAYVGTISNAVIFLFLLTFVSGCAFLGRQFVVSKESSPTERLLSVRELEPMENGALPEALVVYHDGSVLIRGKRFQKGPASYYFTSLSSEELADVRRLVNRLNRDLDAVTKVDVSRFINAPSVQVSLLGGRSLLWLYGASIKDKRLSLIEGGEKNLSVIEEKLIEKASKVIDPLLNLPNEKVWQPQYFAMLLCPAERVTYQPVQIPSSLLRSFNNAPQRPLACPKSGTVKVLPLYHRKRFYRLLSQTITSLKQRNIWKNRLYVTVEGETWEFLELKAFLPGQEEWQVRGPTYNNSCPSWLCK